MITTFKITISKVLVTVCLFALFAVPTFAFDDQDHLHTSDESNLRAQVALLLQRLELLIQLRDLLQQRDTQVEVIDTDEVSPIGVDPIVDNEDDSEKDKYVGVHFDFLWERQGSTDAEKEEDLELLVEQVDKLGVGIVRIPIRWLALYDKPGVVCEDQTLKPWIVDSYGEILNALPSDVEVVAYLDSPPAACKTLYKTNKAAFADKYQEYVSAVVDEFNDRIDYWEIWNEPNNYPTAMINDDGTMWSGEDYVDYVLKPGYRGVSAMSNDEVLLGGMAYNGIIAHYQLPEPTSASDWYLKPNFLEEIYQAGGKNYFDIMAIHPYMQLANPDNNGIANNGEFESVGSGIYLVPSMAQVDNDNQLSDLMRQYGDGRKEVWWTEFGVRPIYTGSEDAQADMTQDALQEAWGSRNRTYAPVTRTIVYTLRDSFRGEKEFGLLRKDNTERPVFEVMQDFATN